MKRLGFTLIELLTVMAISAIIFTIILIPVVQSFNLTRSAQGFADAQDRARLLIDRIGAEISGSAGVRENAGRAGSLALVVPGRDGNPEEIILENVKLDLIRPAQGDPTARRDGAFINPDTGKADPTLRVPKGQVTLPVAPGATIVRYFIGLRRPLAGDGPALYNNPYDGLLMARSGLPDNLYVLYRAEVQPLLFNRTTNRFEPNRDLFEVDAATNQPILDDPRFFLADGTATKARRIRQWVRASTIVTEISRFDMIQPVYTKATRRVVYDGNVPRVTPLIQFRPARQSSEPVSGLVAIRSGEELVNSEKVGPDVYRTRLGGWSSAIVRYWPSTFDRTQPWGAFQPWQSGRPYQIARPRLDNNGQRVGYSLFAYENTGDELRDGVELFDLDAYRFAVNQDPSDTPADPLLRYPFSYALTQANLRSNWLNNNALREMFAAFAPNERQGRIAASFAITEVGDGNPVPPDGRDNRPIASTGEPFTPGNDPNLTGVWTDARYAPSDPASFINQRFNKLWNDWDAILLAQRRDTNLPPERLAKEQFTKRFLDLRFIPTLDGASSPLHPEFGFPRARITPGSEIVIGPDQRPGENYGRLMRYSRVTGRPGVNQYRINYVPIREPDWAQLNLQTPANPFDPATYVATNFVSAILQPQFRAGYLEFNSDPAQPIPNAGVDENGNRVDTGAILIFYRFQFSEPKDVLAADYDSRQIIEINLTIKNFPLSTDPNPQTVTVVGRASVRNFTR